MIHSVNPKLPVHLSCSKTDMRKSINGLAAIVQGSFDLDPFTGALFVFINGNKDKIKVLQWDKDGFALYYKRRERGRYRWPSQLLPDGTVKITKEDLYRLLAGLEMEQFIPHKTYCNW